MAPHRHVEFLDQGVSILGHQPPAERCSVYEVAKAYRLRWQVELLFKEWKSYANLHAFDTQNAAIVEGLIWAAISATALKRFLANTAQVVAGVEIYPQSSDVRRTFPTRHPARADLQRSRIALLTPLRAPSTTSPGTQNVHTLNGIDNVGGCNSVWSRFSRILNYITYERQRQYACPILT